MEIVKIDLVPSGVMPSCHASQYDIGREIRFLLTDGGEEYTLAGTETISIELRKPDGTSETIAIPNTSSNYVDWETSDGELDLSGVYLAEISIKNGDDVLGSANFIVKTEADAYDGVDVRTVTVGPADICTFETTLPEPLQSVIVDIIATGGNGTPDSPNPIVGASDIALVNSANYNLFGGEYNQMFELHLRKGTVITASTSVEQNFGVVRYYDKNGNQINYWAISANYADGSRRYRTITIDADAYYFKFDTQEVTDMMIVLGATQQLPYVPYNGQTYTVNFGQTVYGGVLDVTRGKLHVTGYKVTLDGTQAILASNFGSGGYVQYRFSVVGEDAIENGYIKSSHYQTLGTGITTDYVSDYYSGGYTRLLIVDSRFGSTITSVADWNTWLSNNNVDVVYELDTPFDIDLTPEVISAVVGTNNVFADCGQTTVKYLKAGA